MSETELAMADCTAVDFERRTISIRVGGRVLTEAFNRDYCRECEGRGHDLAYQPGCFRADHICTSCQGRGWNPVITDDGYIANAIIAEAAAIPAAAPFCK